LISIRWRHFFYVLTIYPKSVNLFIEVLDKMHKERRIPMRKVDPLQKCVITNKVLEAINKDDLRAGEKVVITIETKKTGELKSLVYEKGDKS